MTTPAERGQGRGRSPHEGGLNFSANLPPLDPQREGPSEKDIHLSNADIQTLETRIAALISRSQRKGLSAPTILGIGLTGGVIGGAIGAGAVIYVPRAFGAEHENINSFPNSFNPADGERLVETRDDTFDNSATKGVLSEKNTVWLTREEYQKIAPPTIDRKNRKEIHGEFNLPPDTAKATGNKTRKLTLEQDTSINALIYVKTPDGKVRETTYTKTSNPGEVTGRYPLPMRPPSCQVFLGNKGEIQAGDIFPALISGRVYRSNTITDYDGSTSEDYTIASEYYDEDGKKFIASVRISVLGKTQPLIENIPNKNDEAFKVKVKTIDSSGKEIEASLIDKDKIPVVMVQQGEDLLRFTTKPRVDQFSPYSSMKSQVSVGASYRDIRDEDQDIRHQGFSDTFGGENCLHPTLDNKAIVLIQ